MIIYHFQVEIISANNVHFLTLYCTYSETILQKKNVNATYFIKVAFKSLLCEKTQKQHQSALPLKTYFYQMIQHLPGFVLIKSQDVSECNYLDIQLLKKKRALFSIMKILIKF